MPLQCCFCLNLIKENKFKNWSISAKISSDSVCTNTSEFPINCICPECFIYKYTGYGRILKDQQDQQANCTQGSDLQVQILSAVIDDLEKPPGDFMMIKHNIRIIPLWDAKFKQQMDRYQNYLTKFKNHFERRNPPMVDVAYNVLGMYGDLPSKLMSCSKSQMEIIGVIETMDEYLPRVVLSIVRYIDMDIQISDLKHITRARTATDNYPRSIVFGFMQSRRQRDFLKKCDEKGPIYSKNIAELKNKMPNKKLFVSDRLESSYYELFQDCRQLFQHKVSGYWRIVDNKTFVRMSGEYENTVTHVITKREDLERIRILESLNFQQ